MILIIIIIITIIIIIIIKVTSSVRNKWNNIVSINFYFNVYV